MAVVPLDSRISDSISLAMPSSSPRFSYYLRERGLAGFISAASISVIEGYVAAGEICLELCLLEYILEKGISTEYHGVALKILDWILAPSTFDLIFTQERREIDRELLLVASPNTPLGLFVGALTAYGGFEETKLWFHRTLGPLVDAAAASCVSYTKECNAKTNKRSLEAGDFPVAKRARPTHRERTLARYSVELPDVSRPAYSASSSTSLLIAPSHNTPANYLSTPQTTRSPQTARAGFYTLLTDLRTYGQRQLAEFKATAFPDGKGLVTQVYEAFLSVFPVKQLSATTTPSNPPHTSPKPATYQEPPPFRRSRAPSPPSPSLRFRPSRHRNQPYYKSQSELLRTRAPLPHAPPTP
ncbi:hypothetical protein B0H11DRAFT_2185774 [Mycena galericulata]|nr:hypothetical protein B0H11DRAFT_2185774 [Mycena galericulata]